MHCKVKLRIRCFDIGIGSNAIFEGTFFLPEHVRFFLLFRAGQVAVRPSFLSLFFVMIRGL